MVGLPLKGGCMCGALRYEVSMPPVMIYNCHCTNCQKISGAAFNTSVIVAEAALTFTAGEPARVEWVSDQGTTRCGLFCRACGTRIVNGGVPSTGVYSLRAGTLDDTGWVQPVGDTFTSSAPGFMRASCAAPSRCRVCAFSTQWIDTASLCASNSSRSAQRSTPDGKACRSRCGS